MSIQSSTLKHKTDEELIVDFEKDCNLRSLSPETIRRYKSSLRIVFNFLHGMGKSIKDLDKHVLVDILRYLKEEREASYQTLNGYFSALSSFYSFLNYIEEVKGNPVNPFRERYMRRNKIMNSESQRKLLSVEEMSKLINSVLDPRDKAIIALLAKTGVRKGELVDMDKDDIDWTEQYIKLKPKRKRSNQIAFFDDETAHVLKRWLKARENYQLKEGCNALFVGEHGGRLRRHGVSHAVERHAEKVGLHNPKSKRMEDRFSPHCLRHWFTTHLRRGGIKREFLKELRGDSRREAVDIYDHIDLKE